MPPPVDKGIMQFDTIVSNPPFQKRETRGKTPHKLWIDFTIAEMERLLKPHGLLYQISPSSFRAPNSKILTLMKHWTTRKIDLSISDHFPQVGSSFAAYVIEKRGNSQHIATEFTNEEGQSFQLYLAPELFYLPADTNRLALSIHEKVVFTPRQKLHVEHDYVTHHNSRLNGPSPDLSREASTKHVHPVFHTNTQVWFSSVLSPVAGLQKVMWSRSGYTKPRYDNGEHAVTDMAYFVRVPSGAAGQHLSRNLNAKLMHYLYKSARWSGFGEVRMFESLPQLPTDHSLSDAEMYKLFGLSEEEVAYVEAYPKGEVPPDRTVVANREYGAPQMWELVRRDADSHAYMQGVERTVERVAATGEIFTPTELVIELIASQPLDAFAPGKLVLDPACGDGQMLMVAKAIKQHEFHMTEEKALAEIFGVDIMPDNVALARKRLGGGNLSVGDAMDPQLQIHPNPLPDDWFPDVSHEVPGRIVVDSTR